MTLYRSAGDSAGRSSRCFRLPGALLLPRAEMPLNIFEPRYLAMVDEALAGDRLDRHDPARRRATRRLAGDPALCPVGCAGRITSFAETGDGRYMITLTGICRFRDRRGAAGRRPPTASAG